ncbi:hypothetical protein ABBQ32_013058 [Trebouxia sp. C0010 RCD-2024]
MPRIAKDPVKKANKKVVKKAEKKNVDKTEKKVVEKVEKRIDRKRKATNPAESQLTAVSHTSHGKVPGDLFVIGDGDCGQFGLGEDVMEAPRPAPTVAGGQKTLQVAAGGMHSLALTADHEVHSTGVNDEGALGRHTASEAWKGYTGSADAGDAYTWGKVEVPSTHGPVVQVAAGDSHSAVVTEQGAVWAWGTYRDTTGVYGFSPHTRIALLPTLVWDPKKADDQAVKIASGTDHTVILSRGGQVYSWGTAGQGQLGRIGARLLERHMKETLLQPRPVKRVKRVRGVSVHSPIVDIACGSYATYAVDEAGNTWAWGLNNYGQLGMPGQEPVMTPQVVPSLQGQNVIQVRGGQHHALALTQEGQLLSFGRPTYGRMGRLDVSPKSDDCVPEAKPVDNLPGVTVAGMAAGIMVSGCYSSTGEAYLWGANTNSQLGKGDDDEDELVPLKLKETKRFRDRQVIGLEIGGQMAFILSTTKTESVAANANAAHGASHTPPEPAPADALS